MGSHPDPEPPEGTEQMPWWRQAMKVSVELIGQDGPELQEDQPDYWKPIGIRWETAFPAWIPSAAPWGTRRVESAPHARTVQVSQSLCGLGGSRPCLQRATPCHHGPPKGSSRTRGTVRSMVAWVGLVSLAETGDGVGPDGEDGEALGSTGTPTLMGWVDGRGTCTSPK